MVAAWTFIGMGADAQWSAVGGDMYWAENSITWDGANQSDTIELTGFAVTTFDSDVSANTVCVFQFFITAFGEPGGFEFQALGGNWAFVPVLSAGAVAVQATTGPDSGFKLRGLTGGNGVAYLSGCAIAEAGAVRLVPA